MSQEKVHFRVGGKIEHCGVEILPNEKDIEYIVIDHIKFHKTLKVQGSNKENVWTAHFAKNDFTNLPMLLNSTNKKRLAKLAGTSFLEDVVNLPVRLTQELTRDVQDGGEIMGLRISKIPAKIPTAPIKSKEKLTLDSPKYKGCKAHIEKGGTIDELKVKYEISKEVELELLKK